MERLLVTLFHEVNTNGKISNNDEINNKKICNKYFVEHKRLFNTETTKESRPLRHKKIQYYIQI